MFTAPLLRVKQLLVTVSVSEWVEKVQTRQLLLRVQGLRLPSLAGGVMTPSGT
jgi:hypothetical protein